VPAAALVELTRMEAGGRLTSTQVKQVLAALVAGEGDDPEAIAAARGFEAVDSSALEQLVDEAIAAQPAAWEKYVAGEDKALGAIVGAVMKASKGQADGKAVTAILQSRRSGA
jgi:aspartyl-tRNA(Asn)/glutamyl-tRNA(Gln) amidotransferase subunit B